MCQVNIIKGPVRLQKKKTTVLNSNSNGTTADEELSMATALKQVLSELV